MANNEIDNPIPEVTNEDLVLSDETVHRIKTGLQKPNANAIHALAREVEDRRAKENGSL